ncbi:hypothetical protein TRIATDRAFT_297833 [Trichoderma atroviride IMI 206040]|uniref:Uncharacterized protein n=1 Tax=Hypocrea atroviridis (strain ATCC 20476 / IMI 206040) TaxID=452589 RepID=G9NJT6_HYPAI|nr:uncharacterized protein TRIATDRAFT_297833 [Trichoderma atroviride IMI 206040]EHK49159.1 hypothetical protein TRIATDRAFT_297833 [Trichoderma atroviride IMI 206040]
MILMRRCRKHQRTPCVSCSLCCRLRACGSIPVYAVHLKVADLYLSPKLSQLADCLQEPRDGSSPRSLPSMSILAVKAL